MKNIKTIVYDYGGVISKKQNKELVHKMKKIAVLEYLIFYTFYGQLPYFAFYLLLHHSHKRWS